MRQTRKGRRPGMFAVVLTTVVLTLVVVSRRDDMLGLYGKVAATVTTVETEPEPNTEPVSREFRSGGHF